MKILVYIKFFIGLLMVVLFSPIYLVRWFIETKKRLGG